MITLLSPTKTQSSNFVKNDIAKTSIVEIEKSKFLLSLLADLSIDDIKMMMKISHKLACKTKNMIDSACENQVKMTQAIFLFQGDAFQKLDSHSFNASELSFSQDHFIILSALYGYLKPLDQVFEYRLDMKDLLQIPDYRNLYAYWKESVTAGVNTLLSNHKNKVILNLASNEYSDLIETKKLNGKIIQVEFKVNSKGIYKTVGIYAKRGRGLLARYLIQNKIDLPEKIIGFNSEGFLFSDSLSTQDNYVFILNNENI